MNIFKAIRECTTAFSSAAAISKDLAVVQLTRFHVVTALDRLDRGEAETLWSVIPTGTEAGQTNTMGEPLLFGVGSNDSLPITLVEPPPLLSGPHPLPKSSTEIEAFHSI